MGMGLGLGLVSSGQAGAGVVNPGASMKLAQQYGLGMGGAVAPWSQGSGPQFAAPVGLSGVRGGGGFGGGAPLPSTGWGGGLGGEAARAASPPLAPGEASASGWASPTGDVGEQLSPGAALRALSPTDVEGSAGLPADWARDVDSAVNKADGQ